MEILAQFLAYILFGFLGAAIRWIFFLCRKPYTYYLANLELNGLAVVGSFGAFMILYHTF